MTQRASQYIQAESYDESMKSVFQLEENTYDAQNTSQFRTHQYAQLRSLSNKLMQPTGHCIGRRDEQEIVFYTSIPPEKRKRDNHANRYKVFLNAPL